MNVRPANLVLVAVLALLVFAFWRGLGRDPTRVPSPLVGKPVPAFSLPALGTEGGVLTDADLRGPLLLNVWGTWCPGCRAEHAMLLELQRRGVRIVGLAWKDDPDAARAWLAQLGDPYERTAIDVPGRVGIDFGVYGAPETFVIDRRGVIRHKHIGMITERDAAETLLPLLARLAEESP